MLAVTLGVSACTNFFYNRLDTLAAWYIQDLVSLDDTQRSDLRSWLEGTLQWHRSSELALYAKFLRELAGTAAHPGNASTYKGIEAQVEQFGGRLVQQAAPEAARLLMSLSPDQLTEFESNLTEKSRERNEKDLKALADGKWHEKRAKDIEKQLKRWTGSITKQQQLLIATESKQFDSTTADWLESQARWRKAMFGALKERFTAGQSPTAVEERILALLRTPESQWTRAYQTKAAQNREQSLVVLGAIDASLTPEQRSHLQRELNQLAQQLEAMTQS
ncbi:hypothetical protein GCM10011487_00080 [Steroidobacter agaridevorans]|uniref:Lipoprotein n=2 Tax=Steroidobacter agaridevorans TaxID=2695856 RepID=A0A829Y4W0_9GAMM|nr:hypothetical protein GCM10011487_00080 [Steroidobacter agaridevorans]GFE91067.1 hypothetical protein GCM10011488_60210 [Steroidobacter agaridevorans]